MKTFILTALLITSFSQAIAKGSPIIKVPDKVLMGKVFAGNQMALEAYKKDFNVIEEKRKALEGDGSAYYMVTSPEVALVANKKYIVSQRVYFTSFLFPIASGVIITQEYIVKRVVTAIVDFNHQPAVVELIDL